MFDDWRKMFFLSFTHQFHRLVICFFEALRQRNFFNFESNSMETELPCDIHASLLRKDKNYHKLKSWKKLNEQLNENQ